MFRPKRTAVVILVAGLLVTAFNFHAQEKGQAKPQQRKIAFESRRDGNLDIYLVNPDGSNLQRLTNGKDAWEPDWSPDRSKILFTSTLHGGEEEVHVMDADGSNVRRLANTPGDSTSSWSADWSPDGQKIVFMSNRDGSTLGSDGYDLYVMNADGSNVWRVTRAHGWDGVPAWSPDGEHIAFVSDRDGQGGIYLIAADGSDLQRLTYDGASSRPAWSPDGQKIAFMSTRHASEQPADPSEIEIYIMDADGTNIQRLTRRPNADGHPDWSPDGTKIVFALYGDGNDGYGDEHGIYVMDADGTNLQRLTAGGRTEGHPDW